MDESMRIASLQLFLITLLALKFMGAFTRRIERQLVKSERETSVTDGRRNSIVVLLSQAKFRVRD